MPRTSNNPILGLILYTSLRYLKRASLPWKPPLPLPSPRETKPANPQAALDQGIGIGIDIDRACPTSCAHRPSLVVCSSACVRVCVCAAVAVSGLSLRNGTWLACRPPRIGLFIRCSLKLRVECQRKLEEGKNLKRFYMIVTAELRWPEWQGDCRLLRSVSRSQCVCVCVRTGRCERGRSRG